MSTKIKRVAKVLVTDGENVLMGRRSDNDPNRPGQWDFLGGGEEPEDVTFEDVAIREVREEGGIELRVENLQPIYADTRLKIFAEDGEEHIILTAYFLGRVAVLPEATPSGEHTEIPAFTLDEALEANRYPRQQNVLEFVQTHDLLRETVHV